MIARLRIDLDAIARNVDHLKAIVAPSRFAAVVKSNAYGHGLVDVARAIEDRVHTLCVYEIAEAVALREAGIKCTIHVMGPIDPRDLDIAHAANAEITLWNDAAYAQRVASVARRRSARFRIHFKIDTGVARLGIAPQLAARAIANVLRMPELEIAGIFTHVAAAEELDSNFTLVQLARLHDAIAPAEAALAQLPTPPLRHMAASAAAMLWPQTRLDLVRMGIAIYGLWPSPETCARMSDHLVLSPALSWHSELIEVRDIPAEASVGYGRTFRATRASRIGVVPIGYAEGVPRAASNKGCVLIAGQRAPIAGRVCMNMMMVDVTDIPLAVCGSVVTLIGREGSESISASEWGIWSETIDYEIVARLPNTIPREYFGCLVESRL